MHRSPDYDRIWFKCDINSLRQLVRLFLRYVKLNPAQYYMNLRLRRAQELLTHSSLFIMQVTVTCGFQSSSHFCKAYRSLFGHSPSEERRRHTISATQRQPRQQRSARAKSAPPALSFPAFERRSNRIGLYGRSPEVERRRNWAPSLAA